MTTQDVYNGIHRETGRNFGDRHKKHLWAPFPIFDHFQSRGQSIKLNNFSIVDRESKGITRTIKSTSCHKSRMGCYRICSPCLQSSPYVHPLHSPPLATSQLRGQAIISLCKYGSPRGPHFGAKLVSVTFSLRPEEALLGLTLWKLVWTHV